MEITGIFIVTILIFENLGWKISVFMFTMRVESIILQGDERMQQRENSIPS